MFETDQEVERLQSMFDAHLSRANPHMTNIVTPERRLTARQVVAYLQGTKHVAFATVTSEGEPRVSPLEGPGELRLVAIHGARRFNTEWLAGDDPTWRSRPSRGESQAG